MFAFAKDETRSLTGSVPTNTRPGGVSGRGVLAAGDV